MPPSSESVLCVCLNPALDVACEAQGVHPTRKVRTHDQSVHPGGGGVNVARVLAELRCRPRLLYLRGGATGAVLDAALAPLDIETRPLDTAAPVRIAFAVHERASALEYRFVPDGDAVSETELERALTALTDDARGSAGRCAWTVLGGSLPRGAPASTWRRFAQAAMGAGSRVILDTSGSALREALDGQYPPFLVKPSFGELESLAGRRLDEAGMLEVATGLVTDGRAHNVVVSLGAQGALLAHGGDGDCRHVRISAPRVAVRSATGAGDSFIAGMVSALVAGRDIVDAFRMGVAAGAAAVMTPGTALARRADVRAVYAALSGADARDQ